MKKETCARCKFADGCARAEEAEAKLDAIRKAVIEPYLQQEAGQVLLKAARALTLIRDLLRCETCGGAP